jgi:hypothetical protein
MNYGTLGGVYRWRNCSCGWNREMLVKVEIRYWQQNQNVNMRFWFSLGCKIWNRFVWGTSFVWRSSFRVQTLERLGLYCGCVSCAMERAGPSYLGTWRFCEIVTGSPEPGPECNRFPNRRFTSQARSPRSIHVRWELTAPKVEPADRCLTHLGKSLKRRGWIGNPNQLPW